MILNYRTSMIKKILLTLIIFIVLIPSLFAFRFEYNKSLDTISDVTQYISVGLPATLLFEADRSEYLTIGLSYAATIGTSFGVRTILKEVIDRDRPYVGFPDPPPPSSDDQKSFPSGHALFTFASAAYLQTAVSLWYPDSKLLNAMAIANWTLAVTTATFRVFGGAHYVEDVLVGAAIGSGIGFLGPFITKQLQKGNKNAPHVLIGQSTGVHISY